MKARHAPILATAAMLVASGAATAQQMTPKDINYLAHLSDSNRPYYEHFVIGVARFSGIGVVESNGGQANPMLTVDMGAFGKASCMSTNGQQSGLPLPNLRPGDKVSISGSVGGAATGESITRLTQKKEKDELFLLTGTCVAERIGP